MGRSGQSGGKIGALAVARTFTTLWRVILFLKLFLAVASGAAIFALL
jgi:hypothetical protein